METMTGDGELLATALDDVNLRAGPDAAAALLTTIPAGTALTPLAGPEQGFYQVSYDGQTGWVSGEYVEVSVGYAQRGDKESRQNEGKVEGSEPASNAELGAGGIIWPISGGLWYVMQGYNGSSHQNQDGLWQYYYSLDLARRDGNTAGQQVISPVNGVVRWTDPSSGGISIDIGNGHAVAMFHVSFMNGLEPGTTVRQGQYLGEILRAGRTGLRRHAAPALHPLDLGRQRQLGPPRRTLHRPIRDQRHGLRRRRRQQPARGNRVPAVSRSGVVSQGSRERGAGDRAPLPYAWV